MTLSISRLCVLFILLAIYSCQLSTAWWPFSSGSGKIQGQHSKEEEDELKQSVDVRLVPFEVKSADDKFIKDADSYVTLSRLDFCNLRTIDQLKKSCGDISDEELAKLSVALLNCQSKIEGRKTYLCTNDMTIGECTQSMDPDTWNAYHIISNRARSVCYATRQQHFRRQTEYTINRLAETSQNQLLLMYTLQDQYMVLGRSVNITMNTVHHGQQDLLNRNEILRVEQAEIESSLKRTLKQLAVEKELTIERQLQLRTLTTSLKGSLENTASVMKRQELDRNISLEKVLESLSKIEYKAKMAWYEIDKSTSQIIHYHHEVTQHYIHTLENLKRLNQTITFIMRVYEILRYKIENHLDQFADILGYQGDKVSLITMCFIHSVYILIAIVILKFIDIPAVLKLGIMALIAINALSKLRNGKSIRLISITYLLLIIICIHRLIVKLYQTYRKNHLVNPVDAVLTTPQPIKNHYNNSFSDTDYSANSTPKNGRVYKKLSWTQTPDYYPMEENYTTLLQAFKKEMVNGINESNHSSSSEKVVNGLSPLVPSAQVSDADDPSAKWTFKNPRCQASTTTGRQCRLPSVAGYDRCYRHKQTAKK
ncbi:Protein brambleberry [Trichoplax sp. H2]|nr:Protein brambleberry [Trichoplax sp. H2]|eukprot:RDD44256.1 Protein brambleberry [Trichoplax sp. H2]